MYQRYVGLSIFPWTSDADLSCIGIVDSIHTYGQTHSYTLQPHEHKTAHLIESTVKNTRKTDNVDVLQLKPHFISVTIHKEVVANILLCVIQTYIQVLLTYKVLYKCHSWV